MDDDLSTPTAKVDAKTRKTSLPMLFATISIVIALVAIAFSLLMYKENSAMKKEANKVKTSFSILQNDFDSLKNKFASQDTVNKQFLNGILFTSIQHDMESSIVTDDLTISKISFWDTITKMGTSGTWIDIDVQPDMASSYQGKGKFNLPDRELKGKIDDLMQQAESFYELRRETYLKESPEWSKLEHKITIKNYEIGTYKDGKLKLKGE